eukprot:9023979-Ditylum_brightwellii.AAC.1
MDTAEHIAALNKDHVALIQSHNAALNVHKEQSAIAEQMMRSGGSKTEDGKVNEELEPVKKLSIKAAEDTTIEKAKLDKIEENVQFLLASLPNLLDDVAPDGIDDTENEEVERWGDINDLIEELGWSYNFKPLWHDDVALNLNEWKADAVVQN